MAQAGDLIPVGKISGVFGVRGGVKVFSYTEPRDNILNYSPLLMKRQGQWLEVAISGGQLQGKAVVLSIRNVTDRDQALALVGAELAIRREQLAKADKDEFYWADLIGMTVVDAQQSVLGKVDHLLETGAHDVLVIQSDSADESLLIPFVLDEVVLSVDMDKKLIQVDWQTDYL
ncbi:16S rRNA processing protein RimM [Methylophaga frappieri]|jgi:16S rRNA processing protein RimM|uniref:Ribosome maturation factor RimM n=1 Tax=Methylophaga frappieri (strain ATCC BAA-2434 / DSM 25690 / JAM7) TaxID=754477 RepID=I1YGB1_METFJ|nr:ribosome maturation factor RimM [Methylophaga frappieri]AFJ01954.1 16S rRNA processing protein RimM [Methylophaga frappieri]